LPEPFELLKLLKWIVQQFDLLVAVLAYSTPYYQPQPIKATDVRTAPKKKNKTAKRVAIITASLALVACIGIGLLILL